LTRHQSGRDHSRMPRRPIHNGKQLTAARALAGIGIRELAAATDIAALPVHRHETDGVIHICERKRHGRVQRAVWQRIIAALATAGVELLSQGGSFGAGVRWTAPRERRSPDTAR
jgi:hypothetical protein